LLSWLTDCLFNLVDDPKFMALLNNPSSISEITAYLQARNDVSLHLLLCSATRGFISAVCRRLIHLDALSKRALTYYENKAAAMHNAADTATRSNPALQQAYQKMQRFTSSSLVKVSDFDKLITSLSQEVRAAYQQSLPGARPQNTQPGGQQAGGNDPALKRAQAHCELSMLLGGGPPQSFQEVLVKFFGVHLNTLKGHTDPARLFFADYSLLEVEDDRKSLEEKRSKGSYVDVFRRCDLNGSNGVPGGRGHAHASSGILGAEGGAAATASNLDVRWRRCVRCTAVMQNVFGQRPGFTFVLAQQRRCSCGGSWGMLPKDSLIS
jgi:mediator of RNA polymerase II transcription subunit 16